MNTTTRRIAGLGIASAAATVALAAPATARPIPPILPYHPSAHHPLPSGHHLNGNPGLRPNATTSAATSTGTNWTTAGYGAAGGVAVFAAGATGYVLTRRRQQRPQKA